MMRKRLIAVTSAFALAMSLSLGAWAYPSADTFVSGYDEDDYLLLYSVSESPDAETGEGVDCSVEDGTYVYELSDDSETTTVGDEEDPEEDTREVTTYEVTGLELDGDTVTFTVTDGEGKTEDHEYSTDAVSDCDLTALDVTGPEGQVNHGTIVSAFVHSLSLIDFSGPKGCLVAAVAQTDWGKGDQQVILPDEESDNPDATEGPVEANSAGTNEVDLSTSDFQCGPPEWLSEDNEDGEGNGPGITGKPDWAGPPDDIGKPDWAGGDDEAESEEEVESEDEDSGRPDWAGTPGGPNNNG